MALLAPLDLDEQMLWLTDPKTSVEEIEAVLAIFPQHERDAIIAYIDAIRIPVAPWVPLPHQIPPPVSEDWSGWLLLAGRGVGKTAAVTHWLNDHALGPPCLRGPVPHRMRIIAPTLGDASASVVHGDDGLAVINPEVREITRKGGTVVVWPNGAYAYLLGVSTKKDVDRLRAHSNSCADLREEVAAWPYLKEGMEQAAFGLRRGLARWVGATTGRPRPTMRRLIKDSRIRITTAETRDNPHLPKAVTDDLYERYENTHLGQQELKGQVLDEVGGALWSQELIEQYRVTVQQVPELRRVRTYVDPSWGTTNDECGIIVAGLGVDKHVYILSDLSKKTTPLEWGMLAAVGRLPRKGQNPRDVPPREWFGKRSELVGYETNYQGETVRLTMKATAQAIGRRVRTRPINASKGKRLRADPVLLAFEQGRVHIVGPSMPGLEFQLTSWVPPEAGKDAGDPGDPEENTTDGGPDPSKWSPDRLDAMVFAVTDLIYGPGAGLNRITSTMSFGTEEMIEPDALQVAPPAPPAPPVPAPMLPRLSDIPMRAPGR